MRASRSGSSAARTPWPSRWACRSSRQVRMCSGPRSSPPCGASSRPARSAMSNAGAKSTVDPRRSSLERPKPIDAAVDVLARQPGQGARVEGVAGAVGGDDHRDADAGALGSVADRVEHQVGERGDAAEPCGVPARVDLDLQPPAAVGDVVLGGLTDQASYVVLGAEHRPRDVVEPLEPEPALLVGRGQLRWPLRHQGVGEVDAVALGELEQGAVPHRAGEVEVQVGLRKRMEVPHARHRRWLTAFGPLDPGCVDSILGGFPPW